MKTADVKTKKAIRIRRLNLILVVFAALLSVAMVIVAADTLRSYRKTEDLTGRCMLAQQSAAAMQTGSDYLTDRVRTFVVTGDPQACFDFFEEVEVTKRRDVALEEMQRLFSDTETVSLLSEALRLSNELVEIERYAMRLKIAADGSAIESFPAVLRQIQLTDADLALSKEAQGKKAYELVFDDNYQSYKHAIRENTSECERTLVGAAKQAQTESMSHLGIVLLVQTILIAVLLLTILTIVISTHALVIRPLGTLIDSIPKKEPLPEIGSREMRYLTRAYNAAYEQTKEHQDRLAYEATHDHLTGLYNRAVFEEQRINTHKRRQAMVLLDVDCFKQINDTYGHETGDHVLKKVAQALKSSFRSEDYLCRIGGDEFAVILLHTDRSLRSMIERKLAGILEILRDTSDGLPLVTMSIGVAFCDAALPTDDLYRDADAAQYAVKKQGKSGVAFYDDVRQET